MSDAVDTTVTISDAPEPALPRAILRQIEAARLAPRPMRELPTGLVIGADGRQYIRHNGGLVRVAVNPQTKEARAIIPWSKARKKAEKRRRHHANATGTHARQNVALTTDEHREQG